MNPSPLKSTPVKDSRRILGEKSANACLSPAGNRGAVSTPVKRKGLFETAPSPKKLLPSPEFTSRKRAIAQVDEVQTDNTAAAERRVEPVNTSTESTIVDDRTPNDAVDVDTHSTRGQQHDQHHDSEQSQTTPNTPGHDTTRRNAIPGDPDSRKVFIQAKATLLRSRIQSAMPNIRDHQFDRRLSALEAHSRKHPRLSFCASTTTTQRQHPDKDIQSPMARTPQPLPTGDTATDSKSVAPESGLSSPPSTDTSNQHDGMKTPTQTNPHPSAASPVQLSSPPVSVSGNTRNAAERGETAETEKVSTPSQKGDAVDGLLKLMKTGDR